MQAGPCNILLTGVGGQGVLVASQILAETALEAGYDVKKAEVHGMAQRGGSVVSHVRFGRKVFSPLISPGEAHFIVAFEPLEALRYLGYLRPGGTVIMDRRRILPQPVRIGEMDYPSDIEERCGRVAGKVIALKATEIAEELGERRAANVLLLGLLSMSLDLPASCWLEVIQRRVPPKALSVNERAFAHGRSLAGEPANSIVLLEEPA